MDIQKLDNIFPHIESTCWPRDNFATYSLFVSWYIPTFTKGSRKYLMLLDTMLFPVKYDHSSNALDYDMRHASARIFLCVSS